MNINISISNWMLFLFLIFCITICGSLYFLIIIIIQYKTLARRKNVPFRWYVMLQYYYVFWPFICVTAVISQICEFIVKIVLYYQHRQKFKSLLNEQDALYVDEGKNLQQAVVPVLLLVNCEGDGEEFYTSIKQHLNNCAYNLAKCDKFFGTIESWNGYHYIKSDSTDINAYVTKLRVLPNTDAMTRVDLLLLMEEYYAHPLPKCNRALWQVFIGVQPVAWTTSKKCKQYPIIFKFSHCLFDQKNFMKTLLGTFSDSKTLKKLAPPLQKPNIFSKCKSAFDFLKCSYWGLPLALVNSSLLQFDRNVLIGAELGTRKYFCLGKDHSEDLLIKVRHIRSKINFPTSDSCIFETAIILSLSEFYRTYSYSMNMKNFIYVTTIVENSENFTHLEMDSLKYKKSGTCKNEVGFVCLNSPILESVQFCNVEAILSTLNYISSLKNLVQEYGEPEITRKISSGIYHSLPCAVQKLILTHQMSPLTVVSNLTGPSRKISINGLVVKDIYGWCPNFQKTGITFSICTYRNVSHITLNADVNLIGSNADAQTLLDGVYKYINILYNNFQR